ncbi:unnamed protein product [Linum trigynum]|uniref:Uncharacterized protein n=1 Tax=Linum trigynum TaxID=586398 RepID=A0AAV2D8H6_9ROSI
MRDSSSRSRRRHLPSRRSPLSWYLLSRGRRRHRRPHRQSVADWHHSVRHLAVNVAAGRKFEGERNQQGELANKLHPTYTLPISGRIVASKTPKLHPNHVSTFGDSIDRMCCA